MAVDRSESRRGRRIGRALAWTCLAATVFGLAPGITPVRHALSAPLVVHDDQARGDAAYVMQGGLASDERLRAAADLYHMGRVPRSTSCATTIAAITPSASAAP